MPRPCFSCIPRVMPSSPGYTMKWHDAKEASVWVTEQPSGSARITPDRRSLATDRPCKHPKLLGDTQATNAKDSAQLTEQRVKSPPYQREIGGSSSISVAH